MRHIQPNFHILDFSWESASVFIEIHATIHEYGANHAGLLLLVDLVLTSYVLFVTNFAAIGLDKFAEYVVSTSKYTKSVTASYNKTEVPLPRNIHALDVL